MSFWVAGAVIGSAAIGGGTAAYQGHKTREAMKDSIGYDMVEMPQYSYSEPMLRDTSSFLSDNISRLGEGKFPAYYDNALPQIRAGMSDPLKQRYFGTEGDRSGSILDMAKGLGSQGGLGFKGVQAQTNKQFKNYQAEEAKIDAFLASMGVDIMKRDSGLMPQLAMNMPRGPETQIVNYGGGVGMGNQAPGSNIANMMGGIPWENMFSSAGSNNAVQGNVLNSYNMAGIGQNLGQNTGAYSNAYTPMNIDAYTGV